MFLNILDSQMPNDTMLQAPKNKILKHFQKSMIAGHALQFGVNLCHA